MHWISSHGTLGYGVHTTLKHHKMIVLEGRDLEGKGENFGAKLSKGYIWDFIHVMYIALSFCMFIKVLMRIAALF